MAGQFDVHTVTVNISTLGATGTVPVCFIPDFGGAIKVLDAQITGTTAGTPVGLKLIRMTDANPPVNAGTVASWGGTFAAGTITMGAGSVFEATINTAAFEPGQWLAVQNASGTTPAICFMTVSYVTGA